MRPDISEAVSRMHITFGTRSAIRNLPESLETGELVHALVACFYSGSDGLLVLTDRRVIALRDDFSKFRLQAVSLADARALDYAPTVHDGLAVLTDTGRIAVRKMNRQDSDAFAAALVARVPGLIVGASRPHTREPFRPDVSAAATAQADSASHAGAAGLAVAAPGGGHESGSDTAGPSYGPGADSGVFEAPAAASAASPTPDAPVGSAGAAGPASGSSRSSGVEADRADGADGAQTDREVLLGVLADLHAKGLLSAEELAAKMAQVTATT